MKRILLFSNETRECKYVMFWRSFFAYKTAKYSCDAGEAVLPELFYTFIGDGFA